MKSRSYFWNNTAGVNSDIDRHCAKERELLDKISELESKERDSMEERVLHVYKQFLLQLQASKAEVVTKIGRNPKGKTK